MTKPRTPAALAACLTLAAAAPAAAEPPATSGSAALVMDARTGHVMHARGAGRARPIASATKLMTALLTLERARLRDVFTAADYQAAPIESKIGLRPGERMRVRDLLEALLLESANDAAVTLAENIAGSREAFVREMNRRAVSLGLADTSYANPIGFDHHDNRSSARDLARLTRELMGRREFRRIVDLPRATLESGDRTRVVANRNRLVASYPFVSGVKTGHTLGAGYVLVGSGERAGARVITVTLGAPSMAARDADTLALLRWGLGRFGRRTVLRRGQVLRRAEVRHSDDPAPLGPGRALSLVLRRGERTSTLVRGVEEPLEGPIPAGRRVGVIEVRRGGQTVRRVPLVTLERIPDAGFVREVTSGPAGAFLIAVGALGAAASAILLLGRRRRNG